MTAHTAFRVPDGLKFGPSCCGPPSRTRKSLVERFGQCKASAVSYIHFGKEGTQAILTHALEGLGFGPRLPDHVLQKGNGLLLHALMHGFCRYLPLRDQLRDLCRELCQCRVGSMPGPKGHEGQKEFAGNLRRTFNKARASCGGLNVVGSQEVC